jgi:hypothetical protein
MSDQSALRLGETLDAAGKRSGTPVMIEPGDLTTHGVILGMTGSGKTGLGIVLLEEALGRGDSRADHRSEGRHGQPAAQLPRPPPGGLPAVDRRGGGDARRSSRRTTIAEATAAAGRRASPTGACRRHDAQARHEPRFTIFTPGSSAGVPIDVVGSLRAPATEHGAEETRADEIEGFASGLLALINRTGDPLSSADHILISNLIAHAWDAGRDLDLATPHRTDREPADPQAGRVRARHVHAAEGSHGARHAVQCAARIAVVRTMDAQACRSTCSVCCTTRTGPPAPPSSTSPICRSRSASSS